MNLKSIGKVSHTRKFLVFGIRLKGNMGAGHGSTGWEFGSREVWGAGHDSMGWEFGSREIWDTLRQIMIDKRSTCKRQFSPLLMLYLPVNAYTDKFVEPLPKVIRPRHGR